MSKEQSPNKSDNANSANVDKQPSQPKETPVQQNEKKGGNKLGAIAIALVIALGGGIYYHAHEYTTQQQEAMGALSNQISQLQGEIQRNEKQTQKTIDDALAKSQVLLEQQDKTIASLQLALAEVKGRRPNDWLLAEADYLVKMAGRKLWLEHDVQSATTLMESADQRIAQLNDPSLTPLRRAMAEDITTLRAVKLIDRDGLVLRLSSLEQQVAKLPLANALMPEAEPTDVQQVSESVDDWKTNLEASLKDFAANFITYRKRDGNVTPLLSPEQHFYLQENLKAKLETAIRAVYREQEHLYAESLNTAEQWTKEFFDQESPLTQSFLKSLDQLGKQDLDVAYPEKLTSQNVLSDVINERLRREVAPVDPVAPADNGESKA